MTLGKFAQQLIGTLEAARAKKVAGVLISDRPSRGDAQIHRAIGRKFGYRDALPAYSTDPIAANMVDPAGLLQEIKPGIATLRTRGPEPVEYVGRHKNPAIARCIAALRARLT